jgi:hypothetical protein
MFRKMQQTGTVYIDGKPGHMGPDRKDGIRPDTVDGIINTKWDQTERQDQTGLTGSDRIDRIRLDKRAHPCRWDQQYIRHQISQVGPDRIEKIMASTQIDGSRLGRRDQTGKTGSEWTDWSNLDFGPDRMDGNSPGRQDQTDKWN